jgi:hypothetical protein
MKIYYFMFVICGLAVFGIIQMNSLQKILDENENEKRSSLHKQKELELKIQNLTNQMEEHLKTAKQNFKIEKTRDEQNQRKEISSTSIESQIPNTKRAFIKFESTTAANPPLITKTKNDSISKNNEELQIPIININQWIFKKHNLPVVVSLFFVLKSIIFQKKSF